MDLFPPRRRANRLTDSDEVKFCAQFHNSSVFVNDLVSMTISSIDMNIHVYAKPAGYDVTCQTTITSRQVTWPY